MVVVIDAFLDFVQKHRSPDTCRWYEDPLQLFIGAIPADLRLDQLKPFRVQKWIGTYLDLAGGCGERLPRSSTAGIGWGMEFLPVGGGNVEIVVGIARGLSWPASGPVGRGVDRLPAADASARN